MYAHRAAQLGARDREVDAAVIEALFATVTNVDFDPAAAARAPAPRPPPMRDRAKAIYEAACAKAGKTPEKLGRPSRLAAGRRPRRAWSRQGEEVSHHQAAGQPWAPT